MISIPDSARERLEPLVREWSSASDYPRLFGLVCGIVDFHHPPTLESAYLRFIVDEYSRVREQSLKEEAQHDTDT